MNDVRILTYNTQLRSWMMEVGFPPSLPPTYTAPERAKLIAANVLASANDYDIVCLNEVFDEDARSILSDELRATYPYQVTKADLLYTRLVRPGLLHDIHNSVFDLVFEPLLNTAALLALKFEDSGLFLASRWPFSTIPVTQAIVDALGIEQATELFPDGLLEVSFMPYDACAGGDCRASKGVLHARLRKDANVSIDVFMSHTQADDESLGENALERRLQVEAAWEFIEARAGSPPFANPTFYLGDLNIAGGLANDADQPAEWKSIFNTPGEPFTDVLVDQWGGFQCRGAGTGLTDRGYTADVMYEPLRQRLDQIVGSTGPFVTQHVRIDWPLATAPPGIDGVSRLSDHRPLGILLGTPHPHASPPDALKMVDAFAHDDNRLLGPGEVCWYRFNQLGTYEFALDQDGDDAYMEVYLGSDLSTPQPTYRNEHDPERGDRFVMLAPFFVKIGNRFRNREFIYSFRSHRHEGIDPFDAIHLIPNIPHPESFPPAQLNGDSFVTPWPDPDTKFFLLETPRVDATREMTVQIGLFSDQPVKLGLIVARWRQPDPPEVVADTGPGESPRQTSWLAAPDESFLVGVTRHDASLPPVQYVLHTNIDISLLIGGVGGNPVLQCTEETSGWGADDIAMSFESDTGRRIEISNDQVGDFEEGDPRDLWQFLIPEPISYENGLTVTVIEEDDIDDNDVGSVVLPPFGEILSWDRWTVIDDSDPHRITGAVTIDVDDGHYTLRCTLASWDPRV